jgi:hypothetical protein
MGDGSGGRGTLPGESIDNSALEPPGHAALLTTAGAFLYVVANSVPMLGLTVAGRQASESLIFMRVPTSILKSAMAIGCG